MKAESREVLWLDSDESVSFTQLVELSGMTEADLRALVEQGLFVPLHVEAMQVQSVQWTFSANCVAAARTAGRLRRDLDLDIDGLALALTLLERVRALEDEVRKLQAHLPRWRR